LGGLYATYKLYHIVTFIHLYLFHSSSIQRYLRSPSDPSPSWALVTGATDGIGRGFAQSLCAKGFNVILHGRNPSKLSKEKDALLAQWPKTKVLTLCVDASQTTHNPSAIEDAIVAAGLRDLNIRVLINNVGGTGGLPAFARLETCTSEQITTLIDVNVRFAVEITRALLPLLRKNSPSLICNIGSVVSEINIPYLTVYTGSKGFNRAWSNSLRAEMAAQGLDVEVICMLVGEVATDYVPKPVSHFVPNARTMAESGLHVVGCGRDVVVPYWGHALQIAALSMVPTSMREKSVISTGNREVKREEETYGKKL
jgi:short-subunit dehydrogenase